jgi:adenosine deaminase
LVALDLAGDEIRYPPELFIEHFRRGREAGWQITVHAGEAAGPESIWSAIRDLGAMRIGHAIQAINDPELIEYMREEGIGVEANLTSNVQTSSIPDYPDHPLRHYLDQGLMATINTDDPGISNIDLAYEYEVAAPAALLSPEQIRLAQQHAVEIAFLSSEEKDALRQHKSPDRSTQS